MFAKKGFTLVEIMIVLIIISLFIVLLSYFYDDTKANQEKATRFANLIARELSLAREDMTIGKQTGNRFADNRKIVLSKGRIEVSEEINGTPSILRELQKNSGFMDKDSLYTINEILISTENQRKDSGIVNNGAPRNQLIFTYISGGKLYLSDNAANALVPEIRFFQIEVEYKGAKQYIVGDAYSGNIDILKNKL